MPETNRGKQEQLETITAIFKKSKLGGPADGKRWCIKTVNVGYADGHVDTHNRQAIQWQYSGDGGQQSYFY